MPALKNFAAAEPTELRERGIIDVLTATRTGRLAIVELKASEHIHPPLVYLVAPAIRFHPATDKLLTYLSSELEIMRVGLVEDWRRGLRVVMRQ